MITLLPCCSLAAGGTPVEEVFADSEVTDEISAAKELTRMRTSLSRKRTPKSPITESVEGEVEWLNELVKRLFPRIDQHIQHVVTERVMPTIEQKVPSFLKGSLNLERIVLNQAIPQIGPISVRSRADSNSDNDAIIIDMGIHLDAEMVVDMKVSRFLFGIKALLIHGTLTVALRPPLHRPPFFGGMEIYFVNPPDIDMDFTGVADIADFKGIKGLVRTAILSAFSEAMVIPSRIASDLAPGDDTDIADLRFPDPLGVIRLTLLSGKNLLPMDVSFWGKPTTSDPYVVVRLGKDVWRSPTVFESLTPVWKSDAEAYLSLYDDRQHIDFHVWDQDRISKDDRMGDSNKMLARDMFAEGKRSEHEIPLMLHGKDAGSINVATEWFTLCQSKPAKPSQLFVAAKINYIIGLPAGAHPPYRVNVKLSEDVQATTSKSKPLDPALLRPVSEALQVIIRKMDHHGLPVATIADCVSLREEQVKFILDAQKDPVAAREHLYRASQERQATVPRFDQILRIMVPWVDDLSPTPIVMTVLDGRGKQVGSTTSIPFQDLLTAPDMRIEGPFMLDDHIGLHGSLRARWLSES